MKRIFLFLLLSSAHVVSFSQTGKTELYDLVKKLLYDSTGYENVGDWAVGKPKSYPVRWRADRIEMSNDTSINFYRLGTADISVKGKSFMNGARPVSWNIMLKGPRMGYSSFSILTSPATGLASKIALDSLFGNKPYKAKLLKSCISNPLYGFHYYEVKLPKKDIAYLKISWITNKETTAIRIDGYDNYSKSSAKLECL